MQVELSVYLRSCVDICNLVYLALIQRINLRRLFNAKAILVEEQQWYEFTCIGGNKGFHTFPNGIILKVNLIAWVELELQWLFRDVCIVVSNNLGRQILIDDEIEREEFLEEGKRFSISLFDFGTNIARSQYTRVKFSKEF